MSSPLSLTSRRLVSAKLVEPPSEELSLTRTNTRKQLVKEVDPKEMSATKKQLVEPALSLQAILRN
jgi:hypothetical protein